MKYSTNLSADVQTGVILLVIYQLVTRYYGGMPVAYLPFEPPQFLRFITHRGLKAGDFRQVSVVRATCQSHARRSTFLLLYSASRVAWKVAHAYRSLATSWIAGVIIRRGTDPRMLEISQMVSPQVFKPCDSMVCNAAECDKTKCSYSKQKKTFN
jgi:hypothetical protein